MIIGQDKILNRIDSLTYKQFPKTLMLVGLKGSGRHSICYYISERLNLEVVDISDNLTLETISNITFEVVPKIYIIDTKDITVREQNVILKFLEEPLANSFIIVLAENKSLLLPTVLNRCAVWELNSYTKEQLQQFLMVQDNQNVLEVAKTPGQILEYQNHPISEMMALSNLILERIGGANISNALTLTNRLAFKEEKDKYDARIFFDVLLYIINKKYIDTRDYKLYKIYEATNEMIQAVDYFNTDKKMQFDKYLVSIRQIMREENS